LGRNEKRRTPKRRFEKGDKGIGVRRSYVELWRREVDVLASEEGEGGSTGSFGWEKTGDGHVFGAICGRGRILLLGERGGAKSFLRSLCKREEGG